MVHSHPKHTTYQWNLHVTHVIFVHLLLIDFGFIYRSNQPIQIGHISYSQLLISYIVY